MNPQLPMSDMSPAPVPPSGPTAGLTAASDNDKIEPEWIRQAELLVAQTKKDPYEQARALNALKADYLLKRYAKQIKVAED